MIAQRASVRCNAQGGRICGCAHRRKGNRRQVTATQRRRGRATMDTAQFANASGRTLIGADGSKIGKVADVYADRDTRQPEWFAVTTGLFGTRISFVPTAQASFSGDDIAVPYTKDQVKDS